LAGSRCASWAAVSSLVLLERIVMACQSVGFRATALTLTRTRSSRTSGLDTSWISALPADTILTAFIFVCDIIDCASWTEIWSERRCASNGYDYLASFCCWRRGATLSQHYRLVNVHTLRIVLQSKLRESRRRFGRLCACLCSETYGIFCLHNTRCLGTFGILKSIDQCLDHLTLTLLTL